MKKIRMNQIVALALTCCPLFSCVPTVALSDEVAEPLAVPVEEPTAEPTAEPTPEPTAEPTAEPTPEPTPSIPESVLAVQALVDALPSASALMVMDDASLAAAFQQTEDAYQAYQALSPEEQALITGAEDFAALFAVLNSQIATLDEGEATVTFTARDGAYTATAGQTFFDWANAHEGNAYPTANCLWRLTRSGSTAWGIPPPSFSRAMCMIWSCG